MVTTADYAEMKARQIVPVDIKRVEELAEKGMNIQNASIELGYGAGTLGRKIKDFPEVLEAWNRGRARAGYGPFAPKERESKNRNPVRANKTSDDGVFVPDSYFANPESPATRIKDFVFARVREGISTVVEIRRSFRWLAKQVDYSFINTALEQLEIDFHVRRDETEMRTRFFPVVESDKPKAAPKLSANNHHVTYKEWAINPMKENKFSNNAAYKSDSIERDVISAIKAGHTMAHQICIAVGKNSLVVENALETLVDSRKITVRREDGMKIYSVVEKPAHAPAAEKSLAPKKSASKLTPLAFYECAAAGMTHKKAAEQLGVKTGTIGTYVSAGSERPELREAWLKGKAEYQAKNQIPAEPVDEKTEEQNDHVDAEILGSRMTADHRLTETLNRMKERPHEFIENGDLPEIEQKQPAELEIRKPATGVIEIPAEHLTAVEGELNASKLLFRKLVLEKNWTEIYGAPSEKAPEVWAEVERRAAA